MSYYDSEMADRAVQALWKWTKRNGMLWQQPNRYFTQTKNERGRQVVEVRNGQSHAGLLAKYAELASGRLRRLL
jgi:hypothetical protein